MAFADLPACTERSAPSFDETQPEEIERYFSDLEALLATHRVVADDKRKKAAVRYLKAVCTEKLWKTTPAFEDVTKTYDEFKADIFRLYPGASDDRTYTMQDLDAAVGEHAQVGIFTASDLGEYHRQFLLITCYLISKNRMSTAEQSRAFLRGFWPDLAHCVMQRLQLKKPDHMPDDPYDLVDIYDATNFVLMGTSPSAFASAPTNTQYQTTLSPTPSMSTTSSDATSIKIEALTAAVTSLGKMFKTVLEAQQGGGKPRNAGPRPAGATGTSCNFCGGAGHFIRECEVVAEYNRAGKCKRSPEGKVVLPSGAMVPGNVPGNCVTSR